MRYFILFFVFLFFVTSSIGQEIRYTLYLQDPCTKNIEDKYSYSYYLEKDSLKYQATIFDDKTITPLHKVFNFVAAIFIKKSI